MYRSKVFRNQSRYFNNCNFFLTASRRTSGKQGAGDRRQEAGGTKAFSSPHVGRRQGAGGRGRGQGAGGRGQLVFFVELTLFKKRDRQSR